MGTKRIGLGRTEALVENLSRELLMGGSTITARRKMIAATTTKVLTAEDSGAIVTINSASGTFDITLPAVSNTGVHFTFFCLEDTPTADVNVKAAVNTTNLVGHLYHLDSNTADSIENSFSIPSDGEDFLRFDQDAAAGTWVYICSDGTQWLYWGAGSSTTGSGLKSVIAIAT